MLGRKSLSFQSDEAICNYRHIEFPPLRRLSHQQRSLAFLAEYGSVIQTAHSREVPKKSTLLALLSLVCRS